VELATLQPPAPHSSAEQPFPCHEKAEGAGEMELEVGKSQLEYRAVKVWASYHQSSSHPERASLSEELAPEDGTLPLIAIG
jgi:hypothetical protein